MKAVINPSTIKGSIKAPPSKSYTHRAVIAALLADGESVILNPLISDDTEATINACKLLGASVKHHGSTLIIRGTGGKLPDSSIIIDCHASGTTLRLMTAIAALSHREIILTGSKRLKERPIDELLKALKLIGICVSRGNNMEIIVHDGTLQGGDISVRGDISSQFISALLLVAPFAKRELTIWIENVRSMPYITITKDVMESFGVKVRRSATNTGKDQTLRYSVPTGQYYKSRTYKVEGDYSQASYFLSAGAITNGDVLVTGLKKQTKQGDRVFLRLLRKMGCIVLEKNNSTTIRNKPNKAIIVSMADYPDLVQSLAVVAAYTPGKTEMKNISHLKFKETDRLVNTAMELNKMGIHTKTSKSTFSVYGGSPKGAIINPHGDHRIAMSFAIMALAAKGKTTILNSEVVNKSYSNFWSDLVSLGAKIKFI